jgi:hypothetical protein
MEAAVTPGALLTHAGQSLIALNEFCRVKRLEQADSLRAAR